MDNLPSKNREKKKNSKINFNWVPISCVCLRLNVAESQQGRKSIRPLLLLIHEEPMKRRDADTTLKVTSIRKRRTSNKQQVWSSASTTTWIAIKNLWLGCNPDISPWVNLRNQRGHICSATHLPACKKDGPFGSNPSALQVHLRGIFHWRLLHVHRLMNFPR